jgi:WD40 repeat protein
VCGSFSYDGKLLVTVGSDDHNREVIIVWGLQHVLSTRKPVLVAKQSANCNILSIRFSPVDNNRLVSCGHENIKFWRIKNGHLPGTAVVLNHNARNTTFAVFDFEYSYEDPTSLRF